MKKISNFITKIWNNNHKDGHHFIKVQFVKYVLVYVCMRESNKTNWLSYNGQHHCLNWWGFSKPMSEWSETKIYTHTNIVHYCSICVNCQQKKNCYLFCEQKTTRLTTSQWWTVDEIVCVCVCVCEYMKFVVHSNKWSDGHQIVATSNCSWHDIPHTTRETGCCVV